MSNDGDGLKTEFERASEVIWLGGQAVVALIVGVVVLRQGLVTAGAGLLLLAVIGLAGCTYVIRTGRRKSRR